MFSWSFFTGAMGLDIGLEVAGIKTQIAVEIDSTCCKTIRINRPEVFVFEEDISYINKNRLFKDSGIIHDPLILVGGPPCQSFSPAGNRAALNDPRGVLIFEYFRLIKEIRPLYFVFENVGNLLTAAIRHRPIDKRPGKRWNLKSYSNGNNLHADGAAPLTQEEMSGSAFRYLLQEIDSLHYSVQFAIVNSADYGAPQKRIRFIMIGCRDYTAPSLPSPTHGSAGSDLKRYRTLRDAIYDLKDNPGSHSVYTERIAGFFKKIPPGGNWRNLNLEDQKEILGPSIDAGGGKTGFMRRLSWDEPCPTLTTKPNRKGTALCHPDQIRPLSVKEYARIQGFPDNWQFDGAMNLRYSQIGNAVPLVLGQVVGRVIKEHYLKFRNHKPRPQSNSFSEIEIIYDRSLKYLYSFARNKRTTIDENQLRLVDNAAT